MSLAISAAAKADWAVVALALSAPVNATVVGTITDPADRVPTVQLETTPYEVSMLS